MKRDLLFGMGIACGMLLTATVAHRRWQRRETADLAELNHAARNGLQVLRYLAESCPVPQRGMMLDALNQVDQALRAINRRVRQADRMNRA